MEAKIFTFDCLDNAVSTWREALENKRIVLCHGCFDIVHPGHIRHLKFAREQGDFLIVSITPDTCIQKDSNRPLVPQHLRAENLAVLEMVDAVVIASGETANEVLRVVQPDIYVKGSEYAISKDPRFLKEKKIVEKYGGKVAYSSGDVVFSSSAIIRENELETALDEKLAYIGQHYEVDRRCMNSILQNAAKLNVLIVGEALVDDYKYGSPVGVAQQAPVISLSLNHADRFLGGAGALAKHLSSLGASVSFLTSVAEEGADFEFFRDSLNNYHINFINVKDGQREVLRKSHYFADNSQVMQVDNGKYQPLFSDLRTQMIRKFNKGLKQKPDCIVFSDYGYGLLTPDLIERMIANAEKAKIPVFSNISSTLRTQLAKFKKSTAFSTSEVEIRACMHDYESGLSVLVDNVYRNTEIKELYLMLGDGSSIFFRRQKNPGIHNMESIHIPALSSLVNDKMGRGEAFLTGILLGRCFGASEVQSIYLAALCSALHLRKIGNIPLFREGISNLMDGRPELML